VIAAYFTAAGTAEPVERAVLSTRLMGTVTGVLVQEGDRVQRGQVLARIDARDLEARRAQLEASILAAQSTAADARIQAARFRALYADSAATRYQLEQAELGLARAEAALEAAQGAGVELTATASYARIEAPFTGIVTRRLADPGSFAAPGSPILEIQDGSRLRVSVTAPVSVAARLRRGDTLAARIDGIPMAATVEGVTPATGGALARVNALVANPQGNLLPGSAADLDLPQATRRGLLIPTGAIVEDGDLTGVRVATAAGSELRWIKLLATSRPDWMEVSSGLSAGDVILLPRR
jgi:RND family efflux transporter MFP subunit